MTAINAIQPTQALPSNLAALYKRGSFLDRSAYIAPRTEPTESVKDLRGDAGLSSPSVFAAVQAYLADQVVKPRTALLHGYLLDKFDTPRTSLAKIKPITSTSWLA